jgi:RNA polymerase sigma-70 factor, ECF subfamily
VTSLPPKETLRDRVGAAIDALQAGVTPNDVWPLVTAMDRIADQDLEAAVIVAGCLAGHPRAQAAFEERYFHGVRPALRGLGLDADATAEVAQRVRVKLFVTGDRSAAPIVDYLGKGDLGAFVRVVATRIALSDRRAQKPTVGDDALVRVPQRGDPQSDLERATQHQLARDAVERAAASLEPEQRVLLRLHYVDGLTVDEIGATFGVHRATAARRVAKARSCLVALVRDGLKAELDLATAELDSVMQGVQSQLDVSISRILGS